ncbi:hypothetical protein QBC39DRAFT_127498 [Podospora conica]|nr:hypothetical protein QBC39DRAFT_127498 [Schizothecium conicum]
MNTYDIKRKSLADIKHKSLADSYYRLTDLPEVINRWSHNAPQVVTSDYPEVTAVKPDLEADKYYITTTGQVPPPPVLAPETPQKRQKVLGIPRRIFFITCLTIFVLCTIGAFVAVALSTSRVNRIEPDSDSSSTARPPSAAPELSLTPSAFKLAERPSIAATNYTSGDLTRLYVFSQASNGSLLVSLWDSGTTNWTTLYLDALLNTTKPELVLSFIPNTPIAAYSYMNPAFQMRLYALVGGNSIRELVCTDPTLRTSWVPGRLGFTTFLSTREGSRLAALRPQCGTGDDCRNRFPNMAVAYESTGGQLIVAKSPQYRAQIMPELPTPGTEIGLAAIMKKDNVSDLRWDLVYRTSVTDTMGRLTDWTSEGSLEDWRKVERVVASEALPIKCYTTFSFDLVYMMALAVSGSSTDVSKGRSINVSLVTPDEQRRHEYGPLAVKDTVPKGFIPEDAQFDAVAGSAERRVYGAIGGRIHEWQFDYSGLRSTSAVSWSYVGPVT